MDDDFKEIHNKHIALINKRKVVMPEATLLEEVQHFLHELRTSGRKIGYLDQRRRLESYASYWGAYVFEQTGVYVDTGLDPAEVEVVDREDKEERDAGSSPPRQVPQPLLHYIRRDDAERQLQSALLSDDDKTPLVILFGLSGVGKSSLAAHVVRNLRDQDFPGGVLWGNLSNLTPNDQLLSFLGALDSTWHQNVPPEHAIVRDIFWQKLSDAGKRALIVLDDVKDNHQLGELLPFDTGRIGHCRILAISTQQLAHLSTPANIQRLGNRSLGGRN